MPGREKQDVEQSGGYQPGAEFPRQLPPDRFRDPNYPFTPEEEEANRRLMSGEATTPEALQRILKYMFSGR
jgi:hypothetical protein